MMRILYCLIVVVGAVALCRSLVFVDETETVIVTLFNDPVHTVDEPGLTWKMPYHSTIRIDRRLQLYAPRPSEFLTQEKKNVDLDVFVCWRVDDPQRFLETAGDFLGVESRLHDVVFSELAAEVGTRPLDALVYAPPVRRGLNALAAGAAQWLAEPQLSEIRFSEVGPQLGRRLLENFIPRQDNVHRLDEIVRGVSDRCAERARDDLGIELVDVQLKRISLPSQNRESVFDRMRSERARIATQYRAEGKERALKIRAEADLQQTRILAAAGAEAARTRGDAEAEAIRVYADAHQKDPQFYELTRTLEAYRKILDDKTTVLLSADSEWLKYLSGKAAFDTASPVAGSPSQEKP